MAASAVECQAVPVQETSMRITDCDPIAALFGIRDRVECQPTRPLAAARLLLDAEPDIRFTIGPARSPEK